MIETVLFIALGVAGWAISAIAMFLQNSEDPRFAKEKLDFRS